MQKSLLGGKMSIQINNDATTSNLNFKDIFKTENINDESPIDRFYNTCSEYIKLTRPETINICSDLTRLLLMGYVSAVEEYLRNIICNIINICDYAKDLVSEKPIKFGAIDVYEPNKLAVGLFDSASFASEKEIKSRTKDFLGIDIKVGSSLDVALKNFNKVCNLRHCSIHCGGILNAHNAKELELSKDEVGKKLNPNDTQLQQILDICYSFVKTYNKYTFDRIVERWKSSGEIIGEWSKDKSKVTKLLSIFISQIDIQSYDEVGIYKKMIIPPSVEDIAPDEKRNHEVIKKIIKEIIEGDKTTSIFNEMEKIAVSEYEAIVQRFINIDYKLTSEIILCMFNSSDSSTKKIISIYEFIQYQVRNNIEKIVVNDNVVLNIAGEDKTLWDLYNYFDKIDDDKIVNVLEYFNVFEKLISKVSVDYSNAEYSIDKDLFEVDKVRKEIKVNVHIYDNDGEKSIIYKFSKDYAWKSENEIMN